MNSNLPLALAIVAAECQDLIGQEVTDQRKEFWRCDVGSPFCCAPCEQYVLRAGVSEASKILLNAAGSFWQGIKLAF